MPPGLPPTPAVVRDLPDLQHVALLSAQRLLCLEASPLHPAPAGPCAAAGIVPGAARQPLSAAELAAAVAGLLFARKHTRQLAELQQLLPGDGGDARLLFFRVSLSLGLLRRGGDARGAAWPASAAIMRTVSPRVTPSALSRAVLFI